ncbi:hypothetical protein [Soonwooa sp.]|uniref:hypothetical protein n=1 Tax=Soonwooa sp. TaxID=1938592 RepID=UPI0026286608|nr:hypothetical protein [Soonwooa sp.]
MKSFIVLIFSLLSIHFVAQNRYEVFKFEDKYGVVDTSNFSEYIAPTYEKSMIKVFSDLVLFNDNKYKFVDKKTGATEDYVDLNNDLYCNKIYYQAFEKDGKTVLIPKNTSKKLVFNKKYTSAIGVEDAVILGDSSHFDVYINPDFQTPKLKNIAATNVLTLKMLNKASQKTEEVSVFYGLDKILVYDSKFNLLKTYPKKVNSESKVKEVIAPNFAEVKAGRNTAAMVVPREFSTELKDDVTIITSTSSSESFSIKGKYEINIYLMKGPEWIEIINEETKKSYIFRIDFYNKQFMLPKTYQEALGLKFL